MWPPDFIPIADIPPNVTEVFYYPRYNALLNYLFPLGGPFMITPGGPTNFNWSADFCAQLGYHPNTPTCLVVEIKPAYHYDTISNRQKADKQMRYRLTSLMNAPVHFPKVYGLSFLGRRVCFYRLEGGGQIIPHAIQRDPEVVNDVAPQQRWTMDILGDDAENQLRELVQIIWNEALDFIEQNPG